MKTHARFSFDVFLSHNSADKPRVRQIAERLRAAGLRVWFDEWVIKPGNDIYLAIEHGLESSRTLVLCLSQTALESDWVGLERSTAMFRDPSNHGRRFIPLLLTNCDLPDTLRRFQYIDYREESDTAFEELRAALIPESVEKEDEMREEFEGRNTARAVELSLGFAVDQYLFELDRLFVDSRIADWYVPLTGYLESEKETRGSATISIEGYVDFWLKDPSRKQLAILGDYGTGKSWLCLRVAKRLADTHRKATRWNPLPLLITFKRFKSQMDLYELIRLDLFDGYGIEVRNPVELRRGLHSGRILPILDGLDEMAKVLGERTALVAYSRFSLASEIPKVLITCRTHYFYSGSEQRELLSPDEERHALAKTPMFEVVHVSKLDRPRIRECVKRRFDPLKAADVLRFMESTYNLPELCSRPVLLSLVCESYDLLPHLAAASSSTDLYEAYINAWLDRELRDGRLVLEPDAVKAFFEDLAEGMVKEDTLVIDSVRLKQQLSALLEQAGLPPTSGRRLSDSLSQARSSRVRFLTAGNSPIDLSRSFSTPGSSSGGKLRPLARDFSRLSIPQSGSSLRRWPWRSGMKTRHCSG
jgi:hypothetical protein